MAEAATSYAAGHTDYTWTRLDLYKQLRWIHLQVSLIDQWLNRSGMAGDLSTFELRLGLRSYDGIAEDFSRALASLESALDPSQRRALLDDYQEASRSLIYLLWAIHREFGTVHRGPHPSGSR